MSPYKKKKGGDTHQKCIFHLIKNFKLACKRKGGGGNTRNEMEGNNLSCSVIELSAMAATNSLFHPWEIFSYSPSSVLGNVMGIPFRSFEPMTSHSGELLHSYKPKSFG